MKKPFALSRFFAGDDVFVSYARADASDYALELAAALTERGLSCYLDQWGTPPGKQLPTRLKTALTRSTLMVLLASRRAATSHAVREEVETFLRTGRSIIPVDVDGALETAAWFPAIAGLAVSREDPEHFRSASPSAEIIRRIVSAEGFVARSKRLRRVFWGTVAATAAVALVAVWIVARANREATDALAQKASAEQAAAAARSEQVSAESRARQADEARTRAEREARTYLEDAGKQRALAAQRRTLARALELASRSQALQRRPELLADSLLTAVEAADQARSIGVRGVEFDRALRRALALLPRADPVAHFEAGPERVVLSPNGKYLAARSGPRLEIRAVAGLRLVATMDVAGRIAGLGNDGRQIGLLGSDGLAVVDVGVQGGVRLSALGKDAEPPDAALSSEMQYAATALEIWDLARNVRVGNLPRAPGLQYIESLAFGSQATSLAAAGSGYSKGEYFSVAQIWNFPSAALKGHKITEQHLKQFRTLHIPGQSVVRGIALDSASETVAVAGEDVLRLWSLTPRGDYAEVARWPARQIDATAFIDGTRKLAIVARAPGGQTTGGTCARRTLVEIDPLGHRELARVSYASQVTAISFDSTGRLLAIGGAPGLHVWALDSRSRQPPAAGLDLEQLLGKPALALVSGRLVPAAVGHYLASHTLTRPAGDGAGPTGVVGFSGTSLVFAGAWRGWPDRRDPSLRSARAAALSTGGRWAAVLDREGALTLRAMGARPDLARRLAHPGPVDHLLFSPRDRYLLAASAHDPAGHSRGIVGIWSTVSRHHELIEYPDRVTAVAFSGDERHVAIATLDGSVHVREVNGGERISLRNGAAVGSLAFSADDRLLATGDDKGIARVWETGSGAELVELAHEHPVGAVDFSPDGKYLATRSEADNSDWGLTADSFAVRVFLLRPEDLKTEACHRLSSLMESGEQNEALRSSHAILCGK